MNKRLPVLFLQVLLPFLGIAQMKLYVSATGNELQKAVTQARQLRRLNDPSIQNGVTIVLKAGTHYLQEPIVFRAEDAGTKTSPTIITSENERATISGGVVINQWKPLTKTVAGLSSKIYKNVWVATVPDVVGNAFNFRQLWVNDIKAVRAKSTSGETMDRILDWNKKDQTCTITRPSFEALENTIGVEMFIAQWWEIATLRIRKMETKNNTTTLFFQQPEAHIQSEHPWPAPWLSKETGNSPFYLTNAIQFLDEPGEWYLDTKNKLLYYYPRTNENMLTANIVAPYLETLVSFEGTANAPVSNISFENISFKHSSWIRPSQKGNVPHQLGLYMTEAYKLKPAGTALNPNLDNQAWVGRPSAAISLSYTNAVAFSGCSIEHTASTGIDAIIGVKNLTVESSLLKDIGGNGILAGNYGTEGREIHLPYTPNSEADICENINIKNNLLTNLANEDWGTVGIGFGTLRNSKIEYNEINNTSYTGISIGWGWNPIPTTSGNNYIGYNAINHYGKHNYDCAGIYTLGYQNNTTVVHNVIDSIYKAPYAHLPSHWFYLYADEGSSNIRFQNNWTPSTKYLQNANGPGNVWEGNGNVNEQERKQQAGIQKQHQYLLKERTSVHSKQPINEAYFGVIEIVAKPDSVVDITLLKQVLIKNLVDTSTLYVWKNRVVVYAAIADLTVLQGKIQKAFASAEVKVYHDLFYEYSKKKHCTDTTTAKQWDHIVLTTNLVADPKMQEEYLNYHATQFTKWKEVSAGFCNANFQQLLIYKNGRQLVLVISIPKGESLDALNPKTTENNPRVVTWNQLMSKYQEGIAGTKPGEVWVFLSPVSSQKK
jgi:hypothetical protein